MTLRYARHTSDLNKIEKFYTEIVGLERLGGFDNHSNYNGIFLGYKDENWHLEFTTSTALPESKFDEDDCLVFYVHTAEELVLIKRRLEDNAIKIELPRNPYWQNNGIMISDPDGFKIVFSLAWK
ncbi:MAG: hypothetical protein RL660_2656 [Bacteroidota bacterium]|jgi:catechol 2,3-dioxygenase-like lactoylglutathione lyase family enzyme